MNTKKKVELELKYLRTEVKGNKCVSVVYSTPEHIQLLLYDPTTKFLHKYLFFQFLRHL